MPADRSKYPPDWDAIATRVKREANNHCELCGHLNDFASGHVLTVHHRDGDPGNNARVNLVALCQRCHLSQQAATRRDAPGQLHLFGA